MKLLTTDIEGYRSIRKQLTLFIDPSVTVVLGPNDHGKTNLLSAMLHLNTDHMFDDDDLNWDCAEQSSCLPSVVARLSLSEREKEWLLTEENNEREEINRQIELREHKLQEDQDQEEDETSEPEADAAPATAAATPAPAQPAAALPASEPTTPDEELYDEEDADDEDDEDEIELPAEPLKSMSQKDVPDEITLHRVGIGASLFAERLEAFDADVQKRFEKFYPRFELIDPITKLSDSVSADELESGKNDFMRGIFYYAGLDPDDSSQLFSQSDRTQMSITRASDKLNETLKESWSQGKDLRFRLTHDSKEERIDLQIEDPSVTSTYVRASRRSSGFTHYFSLKTILNSRQKDHPAESYILMFDEPGVFLHPSGQFDLLQVLETLSHESQVLYVTHSLFMINKTYPTRHRLVMKSSDGTTIDGKPYVGRWQAVLSALGLTLTGSILFANHVVLTEGDSDPIYIYAMIQKSVLAGKSKLDINSLAVMSTSASKHADVLLRLLVETIPPPKIAVLTDGDKGGKDRLKYMQAILREHQIPEKALSSGTSIEDHLPMIREVYVPSVAIYVAKLMDLEGKTKPDETEFAEKFLSDFDEKFEKGKVTQGVSSWAENAAISLGGIGGKPSKVGIAREYATGILQMDNSEFKLDGRAKSLIDWIHKEAGVPEQHPVESRILAGGGAS